MKTADLVFDRSYINGEWVTAGNATFEVINPASGEVVARVADGGADLTEKAIHAAESAFVS